MIRISSRSLLGTATSSVAIAAAFCATPAVAQETQVASAETAAAQPVTQPAPPTDTQANPENSSSNDQTIVVTGFRAALRSATAKKKNSETVVESVTAEDIGKLPDNSIAESIARLPGLAAQRSTSGGRAEFISIRGFGPDFSTTTLNGRQQTTTNDSRGVEFDQYPSEILAGVDIYKTSEADHTAGGLVGSIDMRTIRPLDYGHRVLAVGIRGTYVDEKLLPKSKDKGGRVFATFVDQFAHDTFGIALSAAYTSEPYQTRDWNAWGYQPFPGNNQVMYGVKTWFETDQLKRLGTTATLQGRLSDNLTMTVDGFYSHFIDNIDQKGFEMPFMFSPFNTITNTTANGGVVTAATNTGLPLIENYAKDTRPTNMRSAGTALGRPQWVEGARGRQLVAYRPHGASHRNHCRGDVRRQPDGGPVFLRMAARPFRTPDRPRSGIVSNYNGANPALVLTDVEGWWRAAWSRPATTRFAPARTISRRPGRNRARDRRLRQVDQDRRRLHGPRQDAGQVEGYLAPPVGAAGRHPERHAAADLHARPRVRSDPVVGSARHRVARHASLHRQHAAEHRLSRHGEGLDALHHGSAGRASSATRR